MYISVEVAEAALRKGHRLKGTDHSQDGLHLQVVCMLKEFDHFPTPEEEDNIQEAIKRLDYLV